MIYFIGNTARIFDVEDIKYATIQDCIDYFKNKDTIEVDTETEFSKRNPKHLPNPYEDKVLCLQLGDINNQYVIDVNNVDFSGLKVLIEDETKQKLFTNALFDLRFIFHWGWNIKNIYDIFLAECILYKGMNLPKGFRGLAQMSERYLGEEVSKVIRGQINWRGLDTAVIRYAAGDVTKLARIRDKQLVTINERGNFNYVKFENRYCISLSRLSYKGFKLNPNKWLKVEKDNKEKLAVLYSSLNNYIISKEYNKYIDNTLFGKECAIKWTSSKQVIPLLEDLGVNVEVPDKENGGMKKSADIKHLKKQRSSSELLPIYIEYKEVQKELTTYGEKFIIDNLNHKSLRVHSEFFQINDTARLSSVNPNLQNIPGTDRNGNTHPLRKCFEPEEGNTFVICDFSQQEPRITAEYSQDPYLIDFILNGSGDSHSLVSTMISEYLLGEHVEVTKDNNPLVKAFNQKIRDIGKMINLGLDYGKSAYTIKDDLKVSQEEAQKLLDIIASKTPQKTAYFKKWISFVFRNGYVISEDKFNSRTYFAGFEEYNSLRLMKYDQRTRQQNRKYYQLKGEIERFARNNRIQNTGALMTKLAHIFADDELERKGLSDKAYIVNCIHDELVAESLIEIAKEVAEILKNSMLKAGEFFCKTIPMKIDPEIGLEWEH